MRGHFWFSHRQL